MEVKAESLAALRTRTSEKWRVYPDRILPLFVAELDYPLAAPIADALIAAVRRSDTGYIGPGTELQDAFVSFARDRWAWAVDPSKVTTTTDVSVVIVESIRQAVKPGDPVVITPPVYPPFFELVPEAGGTVVEVPLIEDSAGWRLDLDGLERAFAEGARALLLCNPHNPVGLVHSPEALHAVADLAERYDVIVISDEIHAPLTYSNAVFTPFLSVSDSAREHGIAAHSASKAWNLAGLKCALFVTASERMSRLVGSMPAEVEVRTSLFGRIASTTAYSEGGPWLDGLLVSLDANRRALATLLESHLPGAAYREPAAGYLAWIDFRPLNWGGHPESRALRAGVALSSGRAFGSQGDGFARLNFGCAPDVLAEAVRRLATAG